MVLQKKFFYYTVLLNACQAGNVDVVKYILLFNKIDINSSVPSSLIFQYF